MKKIKLTKKQIENIIQEEAIPVGLNITMGVHKQDGKENQDYYKEFGKKMDDYHKPLGDTEKENADSVMKYSYDKDSDEYHNEYEILNGQGMLRYMNDPDERFKDRAEKAIAGSPEMGNNPEWANVVTADQAGFTGPDFGKQLVARIKSREEKYQDEDKLEKYDGMGDVAIPGAGKGEQRKLAIAENKKTMKRLNEGLTEKSLKYLSKLIKEKGSRDAGMKVIDMILSRELGGLGIDDLPDSVTLMNGLDSIEEAFDNGDLQGGFNIAKETAMEMIEDEGGMYMEENQKQKIKESKTMKRLNEAIEFDTKPVVGYANDHKDNTHFAIHKPTNSIVFTWDYSDYEPSELKYAKDDYFWVDVLDVVDGNIDKFKKSDFAIVTRKGLSKKGIDLNNYLQFLGQKYDKLNENKKTMKRLRFKKPFNGVENALNLIPESYKVDNKTFQMTDGNENYEIRWEGKINEAKTITTKKLLKIAKKAADVVPDAKYDLEDLAVSYGDKIPYDRVKSVLTNYDMEDLLESINEGKPVVLKASDKNLMNEDMQRMKELFNFKSQDTLGNLKGSERLNENKQFDTIWNKTKNINEMTGGFGFTGEGNMEGMKPMSMEEEEIEEGAKPDFLDLDKDNDTEESMKKAAKEKKESGIEEGEMQEEEKKGKVINILKQLPEDHKMSEKEKEAIEKALEIMKKMK